MVFFALSSSFHAVPNTRPLSDRDDERGNSSDSDHDVVGVDVVDGVVTPPAAAWAARRRRERRFRPRRTTLHLASILAKVRGRRGLRVCLKLLVDEMAPRSLLFTLDACFFQSTHFSFPLFFIPPPFLSSLPPPNSLHLSSIIHPHVYRMRRGVYFRGRSRGWCLSWAKLLPLLPPNLFAYTATSPASNPSTMIPPTFHDRLYLFLSRSCSLIPWPLKVRNSHPRSIEFYSFICR